MDIAQVMFDMEVGLEPYVDDESPSRIDHGQCIPTDEFRKLGLDLLFGGVILTRSQAEYLVEQEKKRAGAEASEHAVEELMTEFEWTEGKFYGR